MPQCAIVSIIKRESPLPCAHTPRTTPHHTSSAAQASQDDRWNDWRRSPAGKRRPCDLFANCPGIGPTEKGHFAWGEPIIEIPATAGFWPNEALPGLFALSLFIRGYPALPLSEKHDSHLSLPPAQGGMHPSRTLGRGYQDRTVHNGKQCGRSTLISSSPALRAICTCSHNWSVFVEVLAIQISLAPCPPFLIFLWLGKRVWKFSS